MLINLRDALMTGKRLPYDAEVEYIQFNGTTASRKYIDTGIKVADPSTIKVEAVADAYLAQGFFHSFVGNGTMVCSYYTPGNSSVQVYSKNFNSRQLITPPSTTTSYVYDGASGFYINGTQQATFTASLGTDVIADISWRFGEYYDFYYSDGMASTTYNRDGKLYSLKIYVNNVLVRDYIPVRKGTVGYLYDRVSGKLFGNAGSGDFVLGPDVVPVEYIESHGTEYIDTGVKMRNGLSFDAEFIPTGNSPNQLYDAIYGVYNSSNIGIASLSCIVPADNSGSRYGNRFMDKNPMVPNAITTYKNKRIVYHQANDSFTVSVDGTINDYGALNSTQTAESDATIMLFGIKSVSFGNRYAKAKGFFFMISDAGNVANKYLPVRVGTDATSWDGAMMDVLTRRIYRNAGTGAFTYGNDLRYPIPAE